MPDNAILLGVVIAVVVVGTIVIASLVVAALCYILYWRQKRKTQHPVSTIEATPTPEVRCTAHTNNNCRAILPQSESIGSLIKAAMFYGDPLSPLVQRSIAQQTMLEKSLTKGGFSSRYIGRWREDRVAVTVFPVKHQHFWTNESTILQLPLMRHDSILSFIAADTVFKKSVNYLYLISEYHPRGTLREHLVKSTLEISEALLLISSLVSGVEYLHSVLAQESRGGVQMKPSIAQTSQNVYVDKSGSCCLSDFALSVTQNGCVSVCGHTAHSDMRYRPPEALAATTTDAGFEGLKSGDVYSLGLILWEVANCCLVQGEDSVYSLPYSDLLDSEATPTRDNMMRIVCEEGKRPPLPDQSNALEMRTHDWFWPPLTSAGAPLPRKDQPHNNSRRHCKHRYCQPLNGKYQLTRMDKQCISK
ncbi:bone morphogenetic protein receptor type-1B-like isoform X1 [Halichondria panicea]|uniref:bone morphogenetic protein receptor type-1B-like isoform X1 n=2 Tax=Halichondria panicea TaxID=6063 RepID=UPI00312BA6AC